VMRQTKIILILFGWQLSCGGSSGVAAVVAVDPPERSTPLEVTPEAPLSEPSPSPTLHLGADGPVIGWITDLALLSERPPREEEGGWVSFSLPVFSPRTRTSLVVFARADALPTATPLLQEALRTATGYIFEVHLDDGTPFAEFSCDEIEVLAEEAVVEHRSVDPSSAERDVVSRGSRTRVRVRDRRGRWIVEGWFHGAVEERGRDDCPPRVIEGGGVRQFTVDGVLYPPPAPPPPGYVAAQRPDPVPSLEGPLWLQRFEGDRLQCQRWQLRRTATGLLLERRFMERWGQGRAEMRESQALRGGPIEYWMFGVDYERRWIRRPDPEVDGLPGMPGQIGAVFPMTLLSVDRERVTWIEAHSVVAFHPDDTVVWYRTSAAGERALPRERSPRSAGPSEGRED